MRWLLVPFPLIAACSISTEDLAETSVGRLYPGPCSVTYARGAEGPAINHNIYTYDADGNVKELAFDHGADGTIDYRFSHTYAAGFLESSQFATGDGEGGAVVWHYLRDEEGRPLEEAVDHGPADGTIDSMRRWTYAADGVSSMTFDDDADGAPESETIYTYGESGCLVREEKRHVPSGYRDALHYTCNRFNQSLTLGIDRHADGTIETSWSYAYDDRGNLVRQTHEEEVSRYVFDGEDRLASEEHEEAGRLVRTVHRTYDEWGNLQRIDYDIDIEGRELDGEIDQHEAYDYTCW